MIHLAPLFLGALLYGNLTVGSMAVNGLEVRSLQCTMEKVNFLSGMETVSALAAQKAAFDACAPKGAAFSVRWAWGGSGTADVAVLASSSKAADACVQKALSRASSSLRGSCTAIILAGDPAAAAAAAATLAPAAPAPAPAPQ